MRRTSAALLLAVACDGAAAPADTKDAAKAESPAIDPAQAVVDKAALAALCIRSTLTVELNGASHTGVLIDKKDGTKRFGWVAATLYASPFNKLSAEQVSRELELQLKVAETMQQAFAATCTDAIKDVGAVVITFVVEQKASQGGPAPGFWVVAGTTRSRSIEFLPAAALADARVKALELATTTTQATGFGPGRTVDQGSGTEVLCPPTWCDALK